jgi:hypothetical protein
VAAAGFAAVCGLAAILWAIGLPGRLPVTTPLPHPQADYRREVEPILATLDKGEEVDLVTAGRNQRAVHWVRTGGAASRVS